jgi:hypothetical protein
MADILKYKTVIGSDGNTSVGIGVNFAQVIKVSRQGEQKDYAGLVAISSLDGSNWTFISTGRRISFGTSFPFSGSEVIHIIYKVSV